MNAPRRALSLRLILILLGLSGVVYLALVTAQLVSVLSPAAAELQSRTADLLSDHDDIAASLRQMRRARREVARLVPPFGTDPAPRPDPAKLRAEVRGLLDDGASLRASVERARIPLEMRLLLAQAIEQEGAVGVYVLEALRAVELNRPSAAVEALRTSGLRSDSSSVLLSAAQRAALAGLLASENRLLLDLRGLERGAVLSALGGVLLFLLGMLVLRGRLYRPIRSMESALHRIAAADLTAEVEVARLDELGRLAVHFNAMTAVLRERAEEETRRRENLIERFGRLLDESSNEICVFDATTLQAVFANRGARVNLGLGTEPVVTLTLPGLLREFDRSALDTQLDHLRRGDQPRLFLTTRQTRRDGTSYPAEMTLQYSTQGGSPVFVTVTEDAAVRHRVRELDQRLRDFALSEQRVLNEGELVPALRAIVPMAAEALRAGRVGVWRAGREGARCLTAFDAAAGGLLDVATLAHASQPANGSLEVPVQGAGRATATLVIEPTPGAHPWTAEEQTFAAAVAGLLARAFDAVERRTLEHALARAQRMDSIGQLAGGVAHDFNNILTAILGNLEASRLMLEPGDPMDVALEEAQQAARRAAELTRQLLTFARHQLVESRVLDLNALTRDAERMLRRLVGASVEMRFELGPSLRPVRMGQSQFEQVLVNLVVNARDATPPGGTITIRTRNIALEPAYAADHPGVEAGDYVELSVEDTGEGMVAEVRDRVFEPFFTTKAVGKGTGLGLAVCYGIVRQAGGDIAVTSEPGRGSSFRVHLPSVEEPLDAVRSEPRPRPARGSETILLVEDERSIRELLVRALAKRGYRVLQAEDGREGVDIAAEQAAPIDLLVSDVVMPRMGGPEMARQLRVRRRSLPVLFMSGYTAEAMLEGGAVEGSDFIAKPFTPEELCVRVREFLDRAPATAARDG